MLDTNSLVEGGGEIHRDRKLRLIYLKLAFAGLFSCGVTTGCLTGTHQAQPVPTPSPAPSPTQQNRIEELDIALASHKAQVEQLKRDNASLNIQILEHKSLIKDLQSRLGNQQQRLDAAIVEVVRSKARLRSLESKAEAASTIAEAEIAISGLKKQITAGVTGAHEEVSKADQLLMMSAMEFRLSNFGGALYLANQAKGQAQAVQLRYRSDKRAAQEDETPFTQPLPLKCLKNTNLRRGPGLDRKIVDVLVEGTEVMGYAYQEGWVRVETLDGRSGWLSRSLISVR